MKILHLDKNHPLLIEQLAGAGHQNDENYTISKSDTEKATGQAHEHNQLAI